MNDITFVRVPFRFMKDVFLQSHSSEYPYICFEKDDNDEEDIELSKFLTDELYKDCYWDIIYKSDIAIAVIATKIENRVLKIAIFEVSKNARSKCYGSDILNFLKLLCKSMRCESICLIPRNEEVKHFYEKNGFALMNDNFTMIYYL